MKRPIIAAGHATAFALALAAGASPHQSLPFASAAQQQQQQQPPSQQRASSASSSTWKQFEAPAPVSVGRHHHHRHHHRRRYMHGRMHVEEGEGGATRNGSRLAGAAGGLWDNLRRRPRKTSDEDEGSTSDAEDATNTRIPSEGTNDDDEREDPMETTDKTDNQESDKADNGDVDKDTDDDEQANTEEASDVTVSALPTQPQPQPQQQQQPSGASQRPPTYIVRPRPPAGLHNHPSNSPLGGLLIPPGVGSGVGIGGIGDPSSSSQSVQSALLSALTKVLIATLLTPGGLRNNPLLSWLLPPGSRERPYLPDPVQRYTFERLNDRYERDGAALERALLETAPAADRVGHFWRRRRMMRRRRHHQQQQQQQQQSHKSSLRMATKKKKTLKVGDTTTTTTNNNNNNNKEESGTTDATTDKQTNQQQLPQRQEEGEHRTVIVLDFCTDPNSPSARHLPTPGHTHAPAESRSAPHDPVELLRDQISFVLEQYHDPTVRSLLGRQVEVVLRVESGGGGVQDFGVAADAVRRIRDAAAAAAAAAADAAGACSTSSSSSTDASAPGTITGNESPAAAETPKMDDAALAEEDDIILTVCVDRIAASGGYMVAAQASRGRLFAAPFALVGSIGVYTERVNIHDALTRLGVRGLVLKAGKSKAPIGTIGEVSESGINAVQEDLDRVHDAFRSLVKDSRQVENGEALSSVMEGECFLGNYAQELGLVDRTITSDAYIAERVLAGDKVLRLRRYDKPKAFGLNLPLSPLDLLLSGGASEDLFGRLKSKVRASLSSANLADTIKWAGIIAGSVTLLKDFQLGEGQYTKTTGPQARYTQGR